MAPRLLHSIVSATSNLIPPPVSFSPEQKEYLQGFMAGVFASGVAPFVGTTSSGQLTGDPGEAATANLASPSVEENVHGTPLGDLCKEERWKYDENPLDAWERLLKHGDENKSPDPENTYRFKTFGLFYVAPTQDSFMLRLRIPACELTSTQLHGLADLADEFGGGYSHVTTRGNLQIRECKPKDIIKILTRVQELGLTSKGAGADNIRNITASPTSGIDPDELIDVRPFAKGIHHYILNHRDLYGLPRKFNIAFDNGGSISVAADTNDIGFFAFRVSEHSLAAIGPEKLASLARKIEPGIYFRVQLGGISGHGDFARDTGLLIKPAEAVAVSAAMVRVFVEHGDRTNRKKARLKYLLDKWGHSKFVAETQKKVAFPLVSVPLEGCEPRRPVIKHGWVGAAKQSQRGFNYIGVSIPVGRMSGRQMHALADLATNYGKGELRLTVWQNILVPHIPDAFVETVKRAASRLGFPTEASSVASGVIACTGNRGCKYSAADTKGHALELIKKLGSKVELESPINIHFTGCPNSCAQHYCGDIGFVGTKLPDGAEGYHMALGGGMDHEQGIGRELFRGLRASEINPLVEKILLTYMAKKNRGESFLQWSRRHSVKELQEMLS